MLGGQSSGTLLLPEFTYIPVCVGVSALFCLCVCALGHFVGDSDPVFQSTLPDSINSVHFPCPAALISSSQ